MAVTAAMVKELREMTGAGMMDCKKALAATDGDMDKAVEGPASGSADFSAGYAPCVKLEKHGGMVRWQLQPQW